MDSASIYGSNGECRDRQVNEVFVKNLLERGPLCEWALRSEFFELLEMIQVVPRGGLYQSAQGHLAAFGVRHWLLKVIFCSRPQQAQIPFAESRKRLESQFRRERVPLRPAVLIEGLNGVMGFRKRLPVTETEGDFAICQMAEDLHSGPFSGCPGLAKAGLAHKFTKGVQSAWCVAENR